MIKIVFFNVRFLCTLTLFFATATAGLVFAASDDESANACKESLLPSPATDTVELRDYRSPSPVWNITKTYFDNLHFFLGENRSIAKAFLKQLMQHGLQLAQINLQNIESVYNAIQENRFSSEARETKGQFTVTVDLPILAQEILSLAVRPERLKRAHYVIELSGLTEEATIAQVRGKVVGKLKPVLDEAIDMERFFRESLKYAEDERVDQILAMASNVSVQLVKKFLSDFHHLERLPEYKVISQAKLELFIQASNVKKDSDLAALARQISLEQNYLEPTIEMTRRMYSQLQDARGISIQHDAISEKLSISVRPLWMDHRPFVYKLDDSNSSIVDFWRSLKALEVAAREFKLQLDFIQLLIRLHDAETNQAYRDCILEGIQMVAEYTIVPGYDEYRPISNVYLRSLFAKGFTKAFTKHKLSPEDSAVYLPSMLAFIAGEGWVWRLSKIFEKADLKNEVNEPVAFSSADQKKSFAFVWQNFDDGKKLVLVREGDGLRINGEPAVLISIASRLRPNTQNKIDVFFAVKKVTSDHSVVTEEILIDGMVDVRFDSGNKDAIEMVERMTPAKPKPKDNKEFPSLNKKNVKKWMN